MARRRATAQTEKLGVNAIERIFLEFGWIFRRQTEDDYGIDAIVEVVEDGLPTGRLIALQIKSGASYFKKRGENYAYYGETKHLEYWANHSLPVFVILHDPVQRLTLFQRIVPSLCKAGAGARWSIEIPPTNELGIDAEDEFEGRLPADVEGARRMRFSTDHALMKELASQSEVYFYWHLWPADKVVGIKYLRIHFGPGGGELAYALSFTLFTHDLSWAAEWFFPWVTYERCCAHAEGGTDRRSPSVPGVRGLHAKRSRVASADAKIVPGPQRYEPWRYGDMEAEAAQKEAEG